jgi:hypothetical protein
MIGPDNYKRPIYEAKQDLDNEALALKKFCQELDCEYVSLPKLARADSILFRNGNARIVVEVKVRKNERLKYNTYMISREKYLALCDWAAKGFIALLLVQWTDDLGYVKIPVEHTLAVGGRYDRGDSKDVEVVVHIDIKKFNISDYDKCINP